MAIRNQSSGGSHRAQRGGWCTLSNPLILLALMALPVLADCPSADLTQDCFVDLADFAVISSQWLNSQTDLNPLIDQWLTGDRLPEDMIVIPDGTFQMGNSKDASEGRSDEFPVHTVTVDSLAMGKYEITNGQYRDFLNSALAQNLITITNNVVYKSGSGTSFPYCSTSSSSSYGQIIFSNNTFSVRTKSGRSMVNDPMVFVGWTRISATIYPSGPVTSAKMVIAFPPRPSGSMRHEGGEPIIDSLGGIRSIKPRPIFTVGLPCMMSVQSKTDIIPYGKMEEHGPIPRRWDFLMGPSSIRASITGRAVRQVSRPPVGPMDMGCMIWRVMSGSGAMIGMEVTASAHK
jgi:hypothetical protein